MNQELYTQLHAACAKHTHENPAAALWCLEVHLFDMMIQLEERIGTTEREELHAKLFDNMQDLFDLAKDHPELQSHKEVVLLAEDTSLEVMRQKALELTDVFAKLLAGHKPAEVMTALIQNAMPLASIYFDDFGTYQQHFEAKKAEYYAEAQGV